MGDGVSRAGFNAVSAEDAAVVVNVVDLGVTLGGGNALLLGIFGGLDEDAVRRAGRSTEETGHAFFQAVFVALQDVSAAKSLLKDRAAQGPLPSG